MEVPGVESGQRQAVAQAVHGVGATLKVRISIVPGDVADSGGGGSCEEVVKDMLDDGPRYPTPHVRNTDGNIIFGLEDADFDVRQLVEASLFAHFAGGSHRILEDLEEDVEEMARNVGKVDGFLLTEQD